MMKKNDLCTLQITGITAEGAGVGRVEGMAVFVPGTALGDIAVVHVVKVLKNYAFARLEQLLTPGDGRVVSDCPVFPRCGGCAFRHVSYQTECGYKYTRVRDALTRIGGLESVPVMPLQAAPQNSRYRNKAQYPIGMDAQGRAVLGFYGVNSHRIVPCTDCLLQPQEFSAIAEAFVSFVNRHSISVYDEQTGQGLLRHLYLRRGEYSGEMMVCIVVNGRTLPLEQELCRALLQACGQIRTVVLNENTEKTNVILDRHYRSLLGDGTLQDTMCGLKTRLSAPSFYQVNTRQAEKLYEIAARYAALTGTQTVLDLYCGAGLIGLSMAKQASKVIGVEVVEQAVKNARQNAEQNGITNAEFYCADAAQAAAMLQEKSLCPDVIVVDPPRKGLTPALVDTIVRMNPGRVVYVSCDPATLARDLKQFAGSGFLTREVTPVDLFPRTAHVESAALLTRE